MSNPMTPTEQEKELRHELHMLYKRRISSNLTIASYIKESMQLITADRKRVALEAKIELIDSMLNSNSAILHDCGKRLDGAFGKIYLEHKKSELKAQQEEV